MAIIIQKRQEIYGRVKPFLDANGATANFAAANNNSFSVKFKQKMTG